MQAHDRIVFCTNLKLQSLSSRYKAQMIDRFDFSTIFDRIVHHVTSNFWYFHHFYGFYFSSQGKMTIKEATLDDKNFFLIISVTKLRTNAASCKYITFNCLGSRSVLINKVISIMPDPLKEDNV